MANITNVFPHVRVSTNVRNWTRLEPEASTATILYAAFYADRGPTTLETVTSLPYFQNLYGFIDFDKQGRTGLGIQNWLEFGGVVKALRLTNPDAKVATAKLTLTETVGNDTVEIGTISFRAASPGTFYNTLELAFIENPRNQEDLLLSVSITPPGEQKSTVLSGQRIHSGNWIQTLQKLDLYLDKDGIFSEGLTWTQIRGLLLSADENTGKVKFAGGDDGTYKGQEILLSRHYGANLEFVNGTPQNELTTIAPSLLEGDLLQIIISGDTVLDAKFENGAISLTSTSENNLPTTGWLEVRVVGNEKIESVRDILSNPNESKVDVLMDFGYRKEIKDALLTFSQLPLTNEDFTRPDIFFFLEENHHEGTRKGTNVFHYDPDATVHHIDNNSLTNTALYTQQFTVTDTNSGLNLWTGANYFLSKLIPFNDENYGVHWPTAGLTRGILDGNGNTIELDDNPTRARKNDLYNNNTNYAEKDSRGVTFMTQRTLGKHENALSYINNSRTLKRITNDISDIGRKYIQEFNDSYTLSNLQSEVNKYIGSWIQRRALDYGVATVTPVALTTGASTQVDIDIRIRFTGVIEIINVVINID